MATDDLDAARRRWQAARAQIAPLQAQVAQLAKAQELAARQGTADEKLQVARATAAKQLQQALGDERAAQAQLAGALGKWLGADPSADVERLDALLPIALLPLRLETRFAGSELWVRVYPDEIFADSHEPELTAAEAALGATFWAAAPEARPDAWRQLLGATKAPHAAWIVQATDPAGPVPSLRATSWTRAVEARLLPDRFLAIAYRNDAEVARTVGRPIAEPLALSVSPRGDAASDVSGDGLKLDDALVWTVDFARAERDGMALRLQVGDSVDQLLVLGVKSSVAPEQMALALADLLDAHRFSRGLAVAPQGAPTSNTSAQPSAFPPDDADGARSYQVERLGLDVTGHDGGLLASALGLDPARLAHLDGGDGREQERARAMCDALWPVTLGYFLEQMMDPVFDATAIAEARRHFVANVRGRGPLPSLRIGSRPYGLLPATSLASWQPAADATGADAALPGGLRPLLALWQAAAQNAPHLGRSTDAGRDLLESLGLDASAREVRVRSATGSDFQSNLFGLLGLPFDVAQAVQRAIAAQALSLAGHPDWQPRIGDLSFAHDALAFAGPLVAPDPLSDDTGLAWDYVQWIAQASLDDLRNERFPDGVTRPAALLYQLLRLSALREFAGTAWDVLGQHSASPPDRREYELIGFVPGIERLTIWQRFDQPLPAVSGSAPLGEYLSRLASQPGDGRLWSYRQSLRSLAGVPTSELERLLTETLDLSSHRLDAWVTSLATARLAMLRREKKSAAGLHVGAYGWVEGLRPAPGGPIDSGGYVQAPSMTHASAAAVLRNAQLTHAGDAGEQFTVDLSSARVRNATSLLEAVRQEQPLGGVLGARFEAALHARALDRHIDPFRRLFPLVGGKATGTRADGAAQAAMDRNVVDGLALRAAFVAADPRLASALPPAGTERDALSAELSALDDAVDAVADLLLAESVFQTIRGTHAGAAASLDALARGARAPDPEVVRQPRSGIHLVHRAAVILSGGAPAWATVELTPRALAEPALDGWAGTLLGDPTAYRCRVNDHMVTLDQLALRPIDLVALAQATPEAQASEVDQRVGAAALAASPGLTDLRVVYDADPAWDRSRVRTFPELLELCSALQAVVGGARALQPRDLLVADESDAPVGGSWLADEATTRASAAELPAGNLSAPTSLGDLKTMLDAAVSSARLALTAHPDADLPSLRAALSRASLFGVAGALPAVRLGPATPPPRDATARALANQAARDLAANPERRAQADLAARTRAAADLYAQGLAVQAEVSRRVAAAAAVRPGPSPSAQVDAAVEKMQAIFGRGFRFLPRILPPVAAELAQALAAAPAIVADDPLAPQKLLRQAAQLRDPLGRWRRLSLYATAVGAPLPPPLVAQLPAVAGERWIGLPFRAANRPTAGRTSLLLHASAMLAADSPWVGLLLDEWSEVIPAVAEQTGLAFHHLSPHARAPNALLLAVAPIPAESWSLDSLIAVVRETMALAKVRAVDLDLLGQLGQLLPAVFVAANTHDETIGARFMVAAEAIIAPAPTG